MDRDYAGTASQSERAPSFLESTNTRLSDTLQILYGVTEMLNVAGFYPPPSASSKGEAPNVENNIRHNIDDTLDRLAEAARTIKEQVQRLA
jgi:hypothetical protein